MGRKINLSLRIAYKEQTPSQMERRNANSQRTARIRTQTNARRVSGAGSRSGACCRLRQRAAAEQLESRASREGGQMQRA